MTVRKTVLGVTSRKRDFAIVFSLPALRIVRMMPLLGTVPIDVNQINAKSETIRTLPSFREAYRNRRCILPVDGFFEWKAIKGQKAKQPYAIAMKDGSPFGIGGLWENWHDPTSGEWMRTFAIMTTDANELVAEIHDCMQSAPRPRRLHPVAERRA